MGNPNASTTIFWNPATSSANTPAHETGHLLGLPDEYISFYMLPGGVPLVAPADFLKHMNLRGIARRIGTEPIPGSAIMGNSSLGPVERDFLNILKSYNDRLAAQNKTGTTGSDSAPDGDTLQLEPFVVHGSRSTGPNFTDQFNELQKTLGHRPNHDEWWNRDFIGGAPGSVQERAESLLQKSWEEQQIQMFQEWTGEGRRLR